MNPYAAPRAEAPNAASGVAEGPPQPWEIGEVVRLAWDRLKANAGALIGSYVVITLFLVALGQLFNIPVWTGAVRQGSTDALWLTVASLVVGQVVGAYFQVGFTRSWLVAARGGAPTFGMAFVGFDRYLPVLASTLLLFLAIFLGFAFLIVPGVILALGLQFANFYIVDAKLGPIDALGASWQATRGHRGMLLLFLVVCFGIGLAGTFACCVGIFVASPLIYVSQAIIFTRISGRAPATAWATGVGGGGGMPPPYGSPPPWQGGPPGYGPPPGPPPGGYGGYGGPPGYGPR